MLQIVLRQESNLDDSLLTGPGNGARLPTTRPSPRRRSESTGRMPEALHCQVESPPLAGPSHRRTA